MITNKLRLLIGLFAVGATVVGTAALAFGGESHLVAENVQANTAQSYSTSYINPRYYEGSEPVFLTYGAVTSKVNGFKASDNNTKVNFTLSWESGNTTDFKIGFENEWLKVSSLKNSITLTDQAHATIWSMTDKGVKPSNLDGYLYWNSASPRGLVYADKTGNAGYPVITLYSQPEFDARSLRCGWSEYAIECLTNLIPD